MNTLVVPMRRRRLEISLPLCGLGALLLTVVALSLASGAMPLPVSEVVGACWRVLSRQPALPDDAIVLWLRLPRVLLAMLAGASLAISGAAMQGLFRNPLVEPGLIGVSSGAALGAIGMIVLGGGALAAWPAVLASFGVAGAAFVGGLAATAVVYLFGRCRPGMATLLLAGIAINAVAMAGIGLLSFLADDRQLRDLSFWTLGSFGGSSWPRLLAVAPWMLLALIGLPRHAAALNVLLLGEREAALLGFAPARLRRRLVALVALATGAAVAMCGAIGFVGLVVPHLIRMVWGPDHRRLLPASALAGAALLVGADTLARLLVAPAELPVGVITALLGGPFFLWLLLRLRIGDAS